MAIENPSDSAEAWPAQLPGLHVAQGVERMVGNREIYQQVLDCFVEDNRTFIPTLKQAIADQDWALCRQLTHSLKGSAATISADELSELSYALERQVIAETMLDTEQVVALESGLTEVFESIAQLQTYSTTGESQSVAEKQISEDGQFQSKLKELANLLQSNDMMAKQVLEELEPMLRAKKGDIFYTVLSTAIAQFNYSIAQKQLSQILPG